MKKLLSLILVALLITVSVTGCNKSNIGSLDKGTVNKVGTLQFKANGEDFVRQGFTSKDGWNITFDHVYVTVANVAGFQTDPPYEAEKGPIVKAKDKISLPGSYTIDLAEGGENAPLILVGEVKDAPSGHYNAISWEVRKALEGSAKGYSLIITGKAEKNGKILDFTIREGNEFRFSGGEYVGEQRKGILSEGGTSDLEMTFHFDHIFGDAGASADDDLNIGALGFEPFAELAEGQKVDIVSLEDKLSKDNYDKWMAILPSLGHVGEGHSYHEEL